MESVHTAFVRRTADNRHKGVKSVHEETDFTIGPDVIDMRKDGLTIYIRREDAEKSRDKESEFDQITVLENDNPLVGNRHCGERSLTQLVHSTPSHLKVDVELLQPRNYRSFGLLSASPKTEFWSKKQTILLKQTIWQLCA